MCVMGPIIHMSTYSVYKIHTRADAPITHISTYNSVYKIHTFRCIHNTH